MLLSNEKRGTRYRQSQHASPTFTRSNPRKGVLLIITSALLLAYSLPMLILTSPRNLPSSSVGLQPGDNKGFRIISSKRRSSTTGETILQNNKGNVHSVTSMLDGDALNASVLLSMDENHEFFSGYGQDRTVYSLLATNAYATGFFIDLAARHPLETSNSRALERELGWNGLCIEGNSRYWDQLSTLRSCTTIGAVVADQFYSNITFADMNRGSGGIVVRSREESIAADPDGRLWEHNKKSKKKSTVAKNEQFSTMQAVSFGTILDTLQVPSTIDYLSLDVEGAEDLVLSSSFPFDRYTFTLMTIEGPFGKDSTASLANRLRSKGYRWLCRNGGGQSGRVADSLWAHESFEEPNDFDPSYECMKNCHSAIEAYKKYGFKLNGDPCV